MNILITDSKQFIGRHLVEHLKNIKKGKDNSHPGLVIDNIWEITPDIAPQMLAFYCAKTDFVFHLEGIIRPTEELSKYSFGFSSLLLDTLRKCNNNCPIMLLSSTLSTLYGRYGESEYCKYKKEGEDLFFSYGKEVGAKILVYRIGNLFGKWSNPNFKNVIATFCFHIANDKPYYVSNRNITFELVYIENLITELLDSMVGNEHRCSYKEVTRFPNIKGQYCYVPISYEVTLGQVEDYLKLFHFNSKGLVLSKIANDIFAKELYETYQSYLPN